MSKEKIAIAFKDIQQLWSFARKINAVNIEINTTDKILVCDCSEADLSLLADYHGKVLKEHSNQAFPSRN